MEIIDRREAIKRTALMVGCTMSGSLISAVMSGCSSDEFAEWSPSALTRDQVRIAADLAEVILPKTTTPGAKDVKVERFIDSLVGSFLSPEEKRTMLNGLDELQQQGFPGLSFEEQGLATAQLITHDDGIQFFKLFKQMTLLGFFTSKIGVTKVLNYEPVPGGYSGCELLSDVGGKTWAT